MVKKNRGNKLNFRKAIDSDLNKILYLRNQKQNRFSSLNNKVIDNLDHYIWWFKSEKKLLLIARSKFNTNVILEKKSAILVKIK